MSEQRFRNLHPEAEGRVKQSMFAVEATSHEYMSIWQDYSYRSRSSRCTEVAWEEVGHGFGVTVGTLKKMPVVISLRWAWLDGHLVLFWHPTSQVVDYRQIDDWFEKHLTARWDNGTRRAHCDADNFHLCINAINDATAKLNELAQPA